MRKDRFHFDGLINFRDLGGFKGLNGKTTVMDKVFRSDSLDRVSDKDIEILKNDLHIRYDVDFRRLAENAVFPDKEIEGIDYISLPLQGSDDYAIPAYPHKEYDLKDKGLNGNVDFLFHWDEKGDAKEAMKRNYKTRMEDQFACLSYRKFFQLLLSLKDDEAVVFHCHDGKDRTGIVSMLYLGLLGVSEQDIEDDYLLTNECVKEKLNNRKKYFDEVIHLSKDDPMYDSLLYLTGVHKMWLEEAMKVVRQEGGYESYLKNKVGLSEEELLALKEKFLH